MAEWLGTRHQAEAYRQAMESGDTSQAGAVVGEVVGLIKDIPTAGKIIELMTSEAKVLFGKTF